MQAGEIWGSDYDLKDHRILKQHLKQKLIGFLRFRLRVMLSISAL